MRRRLLALMLSLALVVVQAPMLRAQESAPPVTAWEETPLGDRGFILNFGAHPVGPIFVQSTVYLMRSDDHGASWQEQPMPAPTPTWRNIASAGRLVAVHPLDPAVIYVSGAGGIFRTADSARTWTLDPDPLANGSTRQIVMTPVAGAPIYRWTRPTPDVPEMSVMRTYDDGLTWETFPPQPDSVSCGYLPNLQAHPTDPMRLFGIDSCREGGGRVWQSRDGGASWSLLYELPEQPEFSPRVFRLAVAPSAPPGRLYLSANYKVGPARRPAGSATLLRSDDDGANWVRVAAFGPQPGDPERTYVSIQDIAVHPSSPDVIYLALSTQMAQRQDEADRRSAVLVSRDGGVTWMGLGNPGGRSYEAINRLALAVDGSYLFGASSHRVWRFPLPPGLAPSVATGPRHRVIVPRRSAG